MIRNRVALFVLPMVTLAAAASAQDIAPPASGDVFVRSSDGVEIRGQLLELRPLTLSLFVEGSRRDMPLETIDRIQTRTGDSVRNGALIGAAIGAGLWGMTAARHGADTVPFPVVVAGSFVYSLIGAGIDAMIPGRTTIYEKPRQGSSHPGEKRAGLSVKFGF